MKSETNYMTFCMLVFLTLMVSMVTSVSLAASSKRGLIVSSSSCILLTSSAVLRSYRNTEQQVRVLLTHVHKLQIEFLWLLFFQFGALPCPGRSSCADERRTVLASCVRWDPRRFWAAPGSSWVWRSCIEKAQPGTVHTSWLPSGGSSHTLMSGEGNQIRDRLYLMESYISILDFWL